MKPFFLLCLLAGALASTAQKPVPHKGKKGAPASKLNPAFVATLDSIYHLDQDDRLLLMDIAQKEGVRSPRFDSLARLMRVTDSICLARITRFIDEHGWLGPDVVGERGASTFFLVIQHADSATMRRYVPKLRAAVKAGRAKASELAMMEDRILTDAGHPQIYGTQVNNDPETNRFFSFPIRDEKNVNKRRAKVGLPPIEEYARRFGFEYTPPR